MRVTNSRPQRSCSVSNRTLLSIFALDRATSFIFADPRIWVHRQINGTFQGTHNNHVKNAIRPIALGRENWLFTGSELAGQRAAKIMSLIATAKNSGNDPHAYLRNVLTRLPTQPNSRVAELLPHCWQPVA